MVWYFFWVEEILNSILGAAQYKLFDAQIHSNFLNSYLRLGHIYSSYYFDDSDDDNFDDEWQPVRLPQWISILSP